MKHSLLALLLPGLIAFTACSGADNEPFTIDKESGNSGTETKTTDLPVIRMDAPTNVRASTATFTGYLDNAGDPKVRERGFIYSKINEIPLIGQPTGETSRIRKSGSTLGEFTHDITKLSPDETYYVRAYAFTASDTIYTEIHSFYTEGTMPQVETLPIYSRLKVAAIAAGKFIQGGDDLESFGICFSEKPFTDDLTNCTFIAAKDTAKDDAMRGEFGVFIDDLQPNTMYHIKAYAINYKDTVYGNSRIFKTSKGGDLTWGWVNAGEAETAGAKDRITEAMDSAKFYYENYSNLSKYIYVQYNPGVQTADCNIEGWMRFGPNERYQWVGTAQHEISHAMGVGTTGGWYNMFIDNKWKEYRATQALRVMMKDMTQILWLSGQHFYNGGINQREEVTNGTKNSYGEYIKNERMLKLNAIVLSAMREDGLPAR